MKKAIILILTICVLGAFSYESSISVNDQIIDQMMDKSPEELYKIWLQVFKKPYRHESAEGKNRFKIFQQTLQEIKDFNAQDQPFKVGLNQFSDMTREEFKETYANLKVLKGEELDKVLEELNFTPYDEEKHSMRNIRKGYAPISWAKYFGPVRNQGQCGSCWAFATTGTVEGAMGKKQGSSYAYLAPQQLVDCDTNSYGCQGGYLWNAFAYVKKYGLELDSSYPYYTKQYACQYNSGKVNAKLTDYLYCNNYSSDTSKKCSASITYNLLQHGPATVLIDAYAPYFSSYKTGIFTSKCTQDNHAVVLVGSGNDPTYGDYWLIRNSWGNTWGDNGYIRVQMNPSNNGSCYIETQVWVPLV